MVADGATVEDFGDSGDFREGGGEEPDSAGFGDGEGFFQGAQFANDDFGKGASPEADEVFANGFSACFRDTS